MSAKQETPPSTAGMAPVDPHHGQIKEDGPFKKPSFPYAKFSANEGLVSFVWNNAACMLAKRERYNEARSLFTASAAIAEWPRAAIRKGAVELIPGVDPVAGRYVKHYAQANVRFQVPARVEVRMDKNTYLVGCLRKKGEDRYKHGRYVDARDFFRTEELISGWQEEFKLGDLVEAMKKFPEISYGVGIEMAFFIAVNQDIENHREILGGSEAGRFFGL